MTFEDLACYNSAMGLTHNELRSRYKKFWTEKKHVIIPPAALALQSGDSTTLFTGSGMQQLIPYLLGETHPEGKLLADVQPSFRSQDIEEIGDNRHTTFFEMLGNWSLGSYFKKEQLRYFYEFLTDKERGVGLDPNNLYVTVFGGDDKSKVKRNGTLVPLERDEESKKIWEEIFTEHGVDYAGRIYFYDAKKNWWSRSGTPDIMPVGEPGGPDSEVFYDFGADLKIHENSPYKDDECHPNCDCGRYIEIGNSVFMQYKKIDGTTLEELPQKNVDFGGGLERLLAANQHSLDVFRTDAFNTIIERIENKLNRKYGTPESTKAMRIIADHLKAATFIIKEGIYPSNKEHGYVLRRLIRRAAIKLRELGSQSLGEDASEICQAVMLTYHDTYFQTQADDHKIQDVIKEEINKFSKSIEKGMHEIAKMKTLTGKQAFDLYQSYGFPLEITEEVARDRRIQFNKDEFYAEFEKHKTLSRTSSAGKFKGGLADAGEQTLKYHTATHLLHQALFDVLGNDVRQEGSNITGERLRFDYYSSKKPEPEDIQKVEEIINTKIAEALPMRFKIMPKDEASNIGAKSFFKEKYPDMVKVYYIGGEDDKPETAYSKEFCGGPHVTNTKDIGSISIYKSEKIGSNMYRVYAK